MRTLFRNPNFARLFFGRLMTNAGDSLYFVAAMWLVHELGGSSFYTGLAGFLTLAPQTLQFLAGPLVDRWPLRKTLVTAELVQGALVLVVPVCAAAGWLSVTLVLVLMPLLALVTQFVYPAQTAALPRILKKEELVQGNSAFSFAYQGVDMMFNAFGGVLVAMVGAVALYLVDSITFAGAAVLFAGLRIPPAKRESSRDEERGVGDGSQPGDAVWSYWNDLREGARYVRKSVLVRILGGSVVANLLIGASFVAVLPAFADARGGPEMYGAMMAAVSAGTLIGALLASTLGRFAMGKLTIVSLVLGGIAWLAATYAPIPSLVVGFFGLAWVPIGVTNVILMATMQQVVSARMMARVASLLASATSAAMPFGSLLGGAAGDAWGAQAVFAVAGAGIFFVAVYWLLEPTLRSLPRVADIDAHAYGLADEPAQAPVVAGPGEGIGS